MKEVIWRFLPFCENFTVIIFCSSTTLTLATWPAHFDRENGYILDNGLTIYLLYFYVVIRFTRATDLSVFHWFTIFMKFNKGPR